MLKFYRKVESWVPFVSRLAPSDTFKIWKVADKLRFDSNIRGITGANVQKGLVSMLFNANSVYLIDHSAETYSDALAEFRSPSYEGIQYYVAEMLSQKLGRSDIDTAKVSFKEKKSLLGYSKVERINDWSCKIIEMQGLAFTMIKFKREKDNEEQRNSGYEQPAMPEFDQYFDSKAVEKYNERRKKAEARKKRANNFLSQATNTVHEKKTSNNNSNTSSRYSQLTEEDSKEDSAEEAEASDISDDAKEFFSVTRKDVSATLWVTPEFPLPLPSLLLILELLSPASSQLSKLKEVLAVSLPSAGFPVKLVIPVMTQVNAAVSFNKYIALNENTSAEGLDENTFTIPQGFRER
jgi:hypothetical protein